MGNKGARGTPKQPYKRIWPQPSAKAWLAQFGRPQQTADLFTTLLCEKVTKGMIHHWERMGIPEKHYHTLSLLVADKKPENFFTESSLIAIYHKGVHVGQFSLAKDIELRVTIPPESKEI